MSNLPDLFIAPKLPEPYHCQTDDNLVGFYRENGNMITIHYQSPPKKIGWVHWSQEQNHFFVEGSNKSMIVTRCYWVSDTETIEQQIQSCIDIMLKILNR